MPFLAETDESHAATAMCPAAAYPCPWRGEPDEEKESRLASSLLLALR